MRHTDYVECHGTGTAVGDPIELDAVHRVFRPNGTADGQSPLLVGSVKTNMGHSEAASGITSIIKATLALENGSIPATIGVKKLNPKIKTDEWGLQIVTEQTEFPKSAAVTHEGHPTRRLGINSFGYGGANAHAILDSAEGYLPEPSRDSSELLALARSKFLLPLSATNEDALDRYARSIAEWVGFRHINVVDLAYTLAARRSKLSTRGFILASQKTLAEDLSPERLVKARQAASSSLPIGFVFTGQGAQWPQMGKELIEESPSFRRSIQALDAVLQKLPEKPSWTLQQAILDPKDTSMISHVTRSQPVCTAIQVAYVQLLAQWGVKPIACIGHSSGEIGAAFASGRLTAAQAIVIAYYRGYVVGNGVNTTSGGMMAAGLSKEASDAEIEELGLSGTVRTACVNSPESVTISGDLVGIEKILAELQSRGVFARKLNTDGRAYHSHHMELIGEVYQDLLETSLPSLAHVDFDANIRWISSVYGGKDITGKVLAAYWRKNLESPVLFSNAVEGMLKDQKLHLVEIGPHSALELPIRQTRTKLGLTDADVRYNSALFRGKDANDCVLSLMGQLYLQGHNIDFGVVNRVETAEPSNHQGKTLPDLPPFTWTYDDILWSEGRASQEFRHRKYPHHDLLGSQTLGGNGTTVEWRNIIKVKDIPWVEGHKLGQDIVFPAAGYLAMAVEAISQATNTLGIDRPTFNVRNCSIAKALQLSADPNVEGIEVFTTLTPVRLSGTSQSKKWFEFSVISYENGHSTSHAQGDISIETNDAEPISNKYPSQDLDLEPLAARNWYRWFQHVGLNFGETFQTMQKIETDRKKIIMHARSQVPLLQGGGQGKSQQSRYIIHPITIDTMFQSAIIASTSGVMKNLTCKVPTMIESARFKAPTTNAEGLMWTVDAISQPLGFSGIVISGEVHDGKGEVCAQVENVTAIQFQGVGQTVEEDERHPMLRVTWRPDIAKVDVSDSDAMTDYVVSSAEASPGGDADLTLRKVGAVVDLLAHKDPRFNILELAHQTDLQITKFLLGMLRAESAFKRFSAYSRGYLTEEDDFFAEDIAQPASLDNDLNKAKLQADKSYGLVIIPPRAVEEYAFKRCEAAVKLVAPGGYVMTIIPAQQNLSASSVQVVVEVPLPDLGAKIYLGRKLPDEPTKTTSKWPQVLIVERAGNEQFNDVLSSALSRSIDLPVERVALDKLLPTTIEPKATIICTVELNQPILSTLTDAESVNVKAMTDGATNLIWLTGGNNLEGTNPDMALVSGLSRALMLEQPSLRFLTIDIDNPTGFAITAQNVIKVVKEAHKLETPEWETAQYKGLLYSSRFEPEETLNQTFRQKQTDQALPKPLKDAKPSQLTIQMLGQYDTLAFEQHTISVTDVQSNGVEVDVKTIALNAKEVGVFAGKDTHRGTTTSSVCAGTVTRVGSAVSKLQVGDRVVVMAPGHFSTLECFPEWCCERLDDNERFDEVSTLPVAFATASYALDHCAKLEKGDSVLIQAGTEDVSLAAVQLAQLREAQVLVTVFSEEDRQWLLKNFALESSNIIVSKNGLFRPAVMTATNGRGVDVVLNSIAGDALDDSWKCIARFGRFVEIGRHDIKNAGRLDMSTFARNTTFASFDLGDLYNDSDQILKDVWQR